MPYRNLHKRGLRRSNQHDSSNGGVVVRKSLHPASVRINTDFDMILIDTVTLALCEFPNSDERYAILSHTWGPACDEVTYDEMMSPQRSAATKAKPGYQKITRTCKIAREKYHLQYAWIDTCCINKDSSAILSEAINSMYRWYKDAVQR